LKFIKGTNWENILVRSNNKKSSWEDVSSSFNNSSNSFFKNI
jgi:hypothetical protein